MADKLERTTLADSVSFDLDAAYERESSLREELAVDHSGERAERQRRRSVADEPGNNVLKWVGVASGLVAIIWGVVILAPSLFSTKSTAEAATASSKPTALYDDHFDLETSAPSDTSLGRFSPQRLDGLKSGGLLWDTRQAFLHGEDSNLLMLETQEEWNLFGSWMELAQPAESEEPTIPRMTYLRSEPDGTRVYRIAFERGRTIGLVKLRRVSHRWHVVSVESLEEAKTRDRRKRGALRALKANRR